MKSILGNNYKKRILSSYFSVTLSIFLVLFLLGVLGFLVLNTKQLTNEFKEKMGVMVILKENSKKADIEQLEKGLRALDYVKGVKYLSKEEAAKEYEEKLGEDFVSFIGDNPLFNSFILSIKSDYVDSKNLDKISKEIEQNIAVSEVSYDKIAIEDVNRNLNRVSVVMLIFSFVFTFISMLLINSSIRLSVYSKRIIIKTMQFVGATKSFIRKPFINTNIWLGVVGATLACISIFGCLNYVDREYPFLNIMANKVNLIIVFGGLYLIGIFICWISTYFAAQKYLNLQTEDLYTIQ